NSPRHVGVPAPRNMKTILTTIATLICLTSAIAGQRFDAATWRNVQTYDVPTLLKQEASLIGKIVAVRFHYRSEKLRHLAPNWYEASIWQHDPKAKSGTPRSGSWSRKRMCPTSRPSRPISIR